MEQNKQNYFYLVIPLLALTVIFGAVVLFVYPQSRKQVSKLPSTETGQVQQATTPKARLSFLPEKIGMDNGKKISVDLNLDFSVDTRLDGADIILTFDPKLVEVSEVVPGKLFSFVSQRKNELSNGRVSVTFLEEKGGGVLVKKGRNKILSLSLSAKAVGEGKMEIIVAERGATTVLTESGTSKKIDFNALPLEIVIQ